MSKIRSFLCGLLGCDSLHNKYTRSCYDYSQFMKHSEARLQERVKELSNRPWIPQPADFYSKAEQDSREFAKSLATAIARHDRVKQLIKRNTEGGHHVLHYIEPKENTMQNKQALQPFDLEKALAGHPVVTRDGRSVEVIGTSKRYDQYPVVALIDNEQEFILMTNDGREGGHIESASDLFMAPRMRTVYINQFKDGEYKVYKCAHEAMQEGTRLDAILFASSIEVPDLY